MNYQENKECSILMGIKNAQKENNFAGFPSYTTEILT